MPFQSKGNWLRIMNKSSAHLYGMNRFLCDPDELMLNSSSAYHFFEALSHISVWILPIVALITNALILLVVLTHAQLNRSSFSVYIKSMAVTDTLVLVFKFLSFENKTSKFYRPSLCTILVFLSDSSVLISIWTIVLITIERALVVIFPIHIKNVVSTSSARVLIILTTIISLLYSTRVLFIPIDNSPKQDKRCHPVSSWQKYRQLNANINDFTHCFVPLSIVIIGNCITLYTVKRAAFKRQKVLINKAYRQRRQSDVNDNQLMLMLLFVTLMFTVYFLPFTIANIISRWGLPFGLCFTKRRFEYYLILRSLFELLKDLNFCTNFIIYCISGRQFRYALFSLFNHRFIRLFSSVRSSQGPKLRSELFLQANTPRSDYLDRNLAYDNEHL